MSILVLCKFTPLGFETKSCAPRSKLDLRCKFTPLGFETEDAAPVNVTAEGVNLPRWGLKQ